MDIQQGVLVEKIVQSLRDNPSVEGFDLALVEEFVSVYPIYAQRICEELEREPFSFEPEAKDLAYFMGKERQVKEVKPDDMVTVDEIQTPDIIFTVHRPSNRILLMSYKRQPMFVFKLLQK